MSFLTCFELTIEILSMISMELIVAKYILYCKAEVIYIYISEFGNTYSLLKATYKSHPLL